MTKSEDNQDNEVEAEPVYDPEGYVQQRRLKDIFDARKKVRERRLQAKQYQIENRGSIDAVRVYRTAIENYLSELRPLFHEDNLGQHYWYNEEVGTIEVSLPVTEESAGLSRTVYKYGDMKIAQKPSPKKVPLEGIGCLFYLPEPLAATFEVTEGTGSGHYGLSQSNPTAVSHEIAIPFSHLDNIMNLANQYLSERGLELDPEDDTEPAQI